MLLMPIFWHTLTVIHPQKNLANVEIEPLMLGLFAGILPILSIPFGERYPKHKIPFLLLLSLLFTISVHSFFPLMPE